MCLHRLSFPTSKGAKPPRGTKGGFPSLSSPFLFLSPLPLPQDLLLPPLLGFLLSCPLPFRNQPPPDGRKDGRGSRRKGGKPFFGTDPERMGLSDGKFPSKRWSKKGRREGRGDYWAIFCPFPLKSEDILFPSISLGQKKFRKSTVRCLFPSSPVLLYFLFFFPSGASGCLFGRGGPLSSSSPSCDGDGDGYSPSLPITPGRKEEGEGKKGGAHFFLLLFVFPRDRSRAVGGEGAESVHSAIDGRRAIMTAWHPQDHDNLAS